MTKMLPALVFVFTLTGLLYTMMGCERNMSHSDIIGINTSFAEQTKGLRVLAGAFLEMEQRLQTIEKKLGIKIKKPKEEPIETPDGGK